MKKYPNELHKKRRGKSMIIRALPVFIIMIIFTVALALVLRYVSSYYGLW